MRRAAFKNKQPLIDAPHGKTDVYLIAITVAIVAFGCLMVYSAGMYVGEQTYGNKYYYVYKQLLGAVLGFAALFALARMDYRKIAKARYIILAISIVLLGLVFIPGLGVENYGARRWIQLPFFTLQPSEIAKFAFIIFAAYYMSKNRGKMNTFLGILPVIAIGGVFCVLIILEPNMSITICMAMLMLTMLFIGGARITHLIAIFIPLIIAAVVLILIEPYRLQRLLAFLDPWQSPLEEGYQLIQSYYSLGAGGWFGIGLFNSRQKYLFLPFCESDFIFSVIGEELGYFGCIVVIGAYIFMIYRAILIARNASDLFGAYLAGGIAAIIAIQVMVNIAVVTGSIPPTGLPLPFISSGSSSLIVFCGGIGILCSVKRYSHKSIEGLRAKQYSRRGNRNRAIQKHEAVVGKRVHKIGRKRGVNIRIE